MPVWNLAATLLIAASPEGPGPQLPFTTANVFDGECSTYGHEWVARERLVVRTEPTETAPMAFELQPRQTFVARTGNVVTVQAGVVRVTAPTEFREALGFEKYGPIQHARKGDRVYVLRFNGETGFDIWFKGKVFRDVEPFWRVETKSSHIEPRGSATGVAESYPKTLWYVQVKDGHDQMGWINMTGAKIAGVDGCG